MFIIAISVLSWVAYLGYNVTRDYNASKNPIICKPCEPAAMFWSEGYKIHWYNGENATNYSVYKEKGDTVATFSIAKP